MRDAKGSSYMESAMLPSLTRIWAAERSGQVREDDSLSLQSRRRLGVQIARSLDRVGAAGGLLGVLLSIGGFAVIGAAGFAADPDASTQELAEVLDEGSASLARVGIYIDTLGSLFFILFWQDYGPRCAREKRSRRGFRWPSSLPGSSWWWQASATRSPTMPSSWRPSRG
jgi:hypothetical protein